MGEGKWVISALPADPPPQTKLFFFKELECWSQNSGFWTFKSLVAEMEEGVAWWCFLGLLHGIPLKWCFSSEDHVKLGPRAALAGLGQDQPKHFIHRQLFRGTLRADPCLLLSWWGALPGGIPVPPTPNSRRLLKFGVHWLALPLHSHHAVKEFFLEIFVPMGSN